jgi:hypothetical protein
MIRFLLLLLFMPSALADESPLFDRPSETGNLFALEREEDPSDFGASEDDGPPEPLVEPLEFAGQEAAIEEGRAALSEDAYPWYDKATDSFVMAKQPPPDREEWKATFAMLLNAIITAFVIGALVVMGWFFYRKRPQREDDDDADSADEEGEPPDAAMALPPNSRLMPTTFSRPPNARRQQVTTASPSAVSFTTFWTCWQKRGSYASRAVVPTVNTCANWPNTPPAPY